MARKILVNIDQCTINFPVYDKPFSTVIRIIDSLAFNQIFGDSEKVKAMNHYDEAIGFYNGQIKLMWSDERPTQGVMLYFTATGLRAWQIFGKLHNRGIQWLDFINYLSKNNAHFTRVDVAVDVLDYPFTVASLFGDIQERKVLVLDPLGREKKFTHQKFFGQNRKVTGFYIGSRSSDCFLRIYDKKIEQDRERATYVDLSRTCKTWTRFEGEFKHKKAKAIIPDLASKSVNEKQFRQKLIGYVVNQWSFVDNDKKLTDLWNTMKCKSNGTDPIPYFEPQLNDRLISLLKWFLTGGATGVFYRISKLFGEAGRNDFLEFIFEYIDKPNTIGHYSVPSNTERDLDLIRAQNPNIKTVREYLVEAVNEIEWSKGNNVKINNKKEANHTGQSND